MCQKQKKINPKRMKLNQNCQRGRGSQKKSLCGRGGGGRGGQDGHFSYYTKEKTLKSKPDLAPTPVPYLAV